MDDQAVIQRVLDGDVDAYAMLVDRYRGAVFAIVGHLLPNTETREDVAQDAFVDAFRALRRFDPSRAQFATWLLTIARNRAINALRHEATRSRIPVSPPRDTPPAPDDDTLRALDAALASLPAEQRLALILAEAHDLTYEQIAAVESIAVGTVKSRIARARATLRDAMTKPMESTR